MENDISEDAGLMWDCLPSFHLYGYPTYTFLSSSPALPPSTSSLPRACALLANSPISNSSFLPHFLWRVKISMGIYSHINMRKRMRGNKLLTFSQWAIRSGDIKTTFFFLSPPAAVVVRLCLVKWKIKELCLKLRLVFRESHLSGLLTFSHSAIKHVSSIKIHNAWGRRDCAPLISTWINWVEILLT